MSKYKMDEKLEELIQEVIYENADLEFLASGEISIACQWCDQEKKGRKGRTYAETIAVPDKIKGFAGYDFIITFYKPNCDRLDREHMKRLTYHELLHVGFDDGKYFVVPHNIEDFRKCIDRWGTDWIRN